MGRAGEAWGRAGSQGRQSRHRMLKNGQELSRWGRGGVWVKVLQARASAGMSARGDREKERRWPRWGVGMEEGIVQDAGSFRRPGPLLPGVSCSDFG